MTVKKAQTPILMATLRPYQEAYFETDEAYENRMITEMPLKEVTINMAYFKGSHFKNVQFEQVTFDNCDFQDILFEHCALLNCSFIGNTFQRVTFDGCQLIGADFAEAGLRDVRFDACKVDYAGFNQTRMRHVDFEECSLQEVAFEYVDWQWLTMSHNDLNGIDLTGTNLKEFDLSRNTFEKAVFSLDLLRGATVSSAQTLVIMSALRINVR